MKKKIIISLVLLIIFFFATVVSIGIYLGWPVSYKGDVIADVNSEVIIERGREGLPQIRAENIKDAYFAVGFLHAQDGLVFMEHFRAVALGLVSEVLGERGVLIDKLAVAVGFSRRAEEILENLKSPYLDYLNFYVDGVNRAKKKFPNIKRFYLLPDHEWTTSDVISILLLFEWADSFANNRELFFPLPEGISKGSLIDIIPRDLTYRYSNSEKRNVLLLKDIRRDLEYYVGSFLEGFAFFIRGYNTIDGKPVMGYALDNNMRVYPKWYPLCIYVNDFKIEGITSFGLPFIFFGRNNKITFFGFNLQVDTQDFCVEKVKKVRDSFKYFSGGLWKNIYTISKTINIDKNNSSENKIKINVRMTDKGPVISDIQEGSSERDVVTLRSILPGKDYISSLFNIPFSVNPRQALGYVRNIYSTPKIYFFASEGKVLTAYSGKLPVRNIKRKVFQKNRFRAARLLNLSNYAGLSKNKNVIIGNKSFEKGPKFFREYYVYNNRNRYNRFMELVKKDKHIQIKDVERFLSDTYSIHADKYIPIFVALLKELPITSAKLCRIYFNDWDFLMSSHSVPATIFQTLLVEMIKETINDELQGSIDDVLRDYPPVIDNFYRMLVDHKSGLFDDINTSEIVENRDTIFDRAFLKTMRFLNGQMGPIMDDWRWGRVHKGHFELPLVNRESFLAGMFNGIEDAGVKGGNSTISKGSIGAMEMLRAKKVTCLTGIFREGLSSISLSYGISLNPLSEYFRNYSHMENYITFNEPGEGDVMRIRPAE